MSWLFNFIFLVIGGGSIVSAHLRHSRRPLWLLIPVVLVAALYNAVTPIAVRRVNLDFIAQVVREAPELEEYIFDAGNIERIAVLPLSFNEPSGDFDGFINISYRHPWYKYLQFVVKIQLLVKGLKIVAVTLSVDRKNSRYFSGISTGPDHVHVPDFATTQALAEDLSQ